MHKQKGKYFSAGGMGQRKFFFWQLHGEAGTWWYQGTSCGQDIWRWLRAGTFCGCSQNSVSVARFWPPFLLGGRGPIQRSGQLCCLNSSQHIRNPRTTDINWKYIGSLKQLPKLSQFIETTDHLDSPLLQHIGASVFSLLARVIWQTFRYINIKD